MPTNKAFPLCGAALICAALVSAAGAGEVPSPAAGVDGRRIETLWEAGQEAMGRGDVEEARGIFAEALELDPARSRSWNYLGGAYFAGGDYPQALKHFEEAFSRDPGDARACNNIGTAHERLGNVGEAEIHYLRAAEIDGAYAVPFRNLGALYAGRMDRPRLAVTYLEHYLELAPEGPESDMVREQILRLREGD